MVRILFILIFFVGFSSSYGTDHKINPFVDTIDIDGTAYKACQYQRIIGGDYAHEKGFTGKGVKIGVIDIGIFDPEGTKNITEINGPQNAVDFTQENEDDVNHPNLVVSTLSDIAPESEILL